MSGKAGVVEVAPGAQVQRLWDLWSRLQATVEQKKQVGLAYIEHALGLGEEVARQFADGDSAAYHQVGLCQANLPEEAGNPAFWLDVFGVFPGAHSAEDIEYLEETGSSVAALSLLIKLAGHPGQDPSLIGRILGNAHAYK